MSLLGMRNLMIEVVKAVYRMLSGENGRGQGTLTRVAA